MPTAVDLRGVFPVLATPFAEDGKPDRDGLHSIVNYVLDAGAHGIVFPAVASEFYSLTDRERQDLAELILDQVAGKIPVVIAASAPTAELAIELARHAEDAGATSIMLMAPYIVKESQTGIETYYQRVAEAVDLPIILQNAPAPLGSALAVDSVLELARQVPQIQYVKEENLPCGQRISKILQGAPSSLKGVFGGAGGRYIIDELNRGAAGNMPACELTELHVALYDQHVAGNRTEARSLFNRMLPLLNFQAVFRSSMTKQVLKRRGIIDCASSRVGGASLDGMDHRELDELLSAVSDLLMESAAT